MADANYSPESFKKRLHKWEAGEVIQGEPMMLFRNDAAKDLPSNLAITDAKSLYDALRREARGKEPRVAIAVGEIKQSLIVTGCTARWCPHNEMICDPLTERMHKTNLRPLLKLMHTGVYRLGSELEEMDYRDKEKAEGRTLQRLEGKNEGFRSDGGQASSY